MTTYQVGDLVTATGYGRTETGLVVAVHHYPENETLYEVRTIPAGVLPYTVDTLTPIVDRPAPGQWWTSLDGKHRLRVDRLEDGGLTAQCSRLLDSQIVPARFRYILPGHYRLDV